MRTNKTNKTLLKILSYILERHPDEFGLIPDIDGYFAIKELLKALHEEDGLKHIRLSHIKELMLTMSTDFPFELKDTHIRSINRENLMTVMQNQPPPKLLYTPIRTKAYGHVLEKGIAPQGGEYVILTVTNEMAVRLGQRKDPKPTILKVQTQLSLQNEVHFHQFGNNLFLASYIPVNCFTGPSLPKQKPAPPKKNASATKQIPNIDNSSPTPPRHHHPGSFYPDFTEKPSKSKSSSWKRDKKRLRREKEKLRYQ